MNIKKILLVSGILLLGSYPNTTSLRASIFKFKKRVLEQSYIRATLGSSILKDKWPSSISQESKNYSVDFTINQKLQNFVKKRMRTYRPDHIAVVVIDNNTGKVLSSVDYDRKTKKYGNRLTLSSTHPAASVFKIVTAAELVKQSEIEPETKFKFTGRSTTLYKYQLKKPKRWIRKHSLNKAFALSNNVVFGKAAMKHLYATDLIKMADAMGFHKSLLDEVDLGKSVTYIPSNLYGLAELASGFNRKTMISPMHGAVIASIIANEGVLVRPYIIDNVFEEGTLSSVWSGTEHKESVMDTEVARDLENMMNATVVRGTATSAFRTMRRSKLWKKIRVGGKTGTITGGLPYGKRDWFVAFAKPLHKDDKGISICVMIVNKKKWYVRSSVFAQQLIEYYYRNVDKV